MVACVSDSYYGKIDVCLCVCVCVCVCVVQMGIPIVD